MTVPTQTAAGIAERNVPAPAVFEVPDRVGAHGDLTVDRIQLGALLRRVCPSGTEIAPDRGGLWTLTLPAAGVRVDGETFDELAANAVNSLRQRVAERDPEGASGDGLVWLVLTSTDTELRSWLHIPS